MKKSLGQSVSDSPYMRELKEAARREALRRTGGVQLTPRTSGVQSTQVPGRSTVHGVGR